MATEGFKKEQEILRMLFLYGGAYNRRQFAEKLGMGTRAYELVTVK